MPTRHTELPLNEKSLNAVIDAMSVVTLCLTQILSPEQRERFGKDLVTLAEVAGRMKGVPLDGDTLLTARDLGIALGD